MNYFLIDYENVGPDGIREFSNFNEKDGIYFFYSENYKNITLEIIEKIYELNLEFKCFKVKNGKKDALDFQLCSYLGYLINKNGITANYYIVSNDKGYESVIDFWSNQNINVKRITLKEPLVLKEEVKEISETPKPLKKKKKVHNTNPVSKDTIIETVGIDNDPEFILEVFNKYKSKQAIYNGMSKHFKDSKRASTLYKKLKPLFVIHKKS